MQAPMSIAMPTDETDTSDRSPAARTKERNHNRSPRPACQCERSAPHQRRIVASATMTANTAATIDPHNTASRPDAPMFDIGSMFASRRCSRPSAPPRMRHLPDTAGRNSSPTRAAAESNTSRREFRRARRSETRSRKETRSTSRS